MTISRKMGLGFGIILAFVATLSIVVLFNLANIDRQFSFVIRHDALVIANARQLLTLVVDLETGQRGFVITGKDAFLEPYEKALATFAGLLREEKKLVSDNAQQIELLEQIEASLEEWQKKAARPEIAMRRKVSEATVDAHQLQEILSKGVGKDILDEIRTIEAEMVDRFKIDGNMNGVFFVELIQRLIVDRETGERGFLITGKEEFLEPYYAGQEQLQEAFSQLRTLVANAHDRAGTVSDLHALASLYDKWVKEAAEPEMALRRQVDAGQKTPRHIEHVLIQSLGKSTLDEMRRIMGSMGNRFE